MMRAETGTPAVIVMTSEVVAIDGTFYCPENTAKAEYEFNELVTKASVLDLDELFEGPNEWRLKDWQAEVWVPEGIPVAAFTEIWFRTTEDRDAAVAACAGIAANLPHVIQFIAPGRIHF